MHWPRLTALVGLLTTPAYASLSTLSPPDYSQPLSPVLTTSGHVVGHPVQANPNVSEYLGIPFAHAPTGHLRFAAPVPLTSNQTIHASSFGPACPQVAAAAPPNLPPNAHNYLSATLGVGLPQNEDCLFLNVWTPPPSPTPHAVLVWIHGGTFISGSPSIPTYYGPRLVAQESIILVSISYRLGVFGFPGSPHLPKNLGLLDQRLALEWVRDNIGAFGGDPARITLFGQSAGGTSVDFYTHAWAHDPIIAGAIMQSGTALSFPNFLPHSAETSWARLLAQLNCSDDTNLLSLPAAQIISATESLPPVSSLGVAFAPVVDNITVFQDYTRLPTPQIPILTGSVNYESGLFRFFGNRSDRAWYTNDQETYVCPAQAAARTRTQSGVGAWWYYYAGTFENLLLPTVDLSQAYHTAELPALFGTSEEVTLDKDSAEESVHGAYMRRAWAAFARDPARGLERLGWPAYDAGRGSVVGLGPGNDYAGFTTLREGAVDALCTTPFEGAGNV